MSTFSKTMDELSAIDSEVTSTVISDPKTTATLSVSVISEIKLYTDSKTLGSHVSHPFKS